MPRTINCSWSTNSFRSTLKQFPPPTMRTTFRFILLVSIRNHSNLCSGLWSLMMGKWQKCMVITAVFRCTEELSSCASIQHYMLRRTDSSSNISISSASPYSVASNESDSSGWESPNGSRARHTRHLPPPTTLRIHWETCPSSQLSQRPKPKSCSHHPNRNERSRWQKKRSSQTPGKRAKVQRRRPSLRPALA